MSRDVLLRTPKRSSSSSPRFESSSTSRYRARRYEPALPSSIECCCAVQNAMGTEDPSADAKSSHAQTSQSSGSGRQCLDSQAFPSRLAEIEIQACEASCELSVLALYRFSY